MVWLHHKKAVHLHHKGVHLSPLGFAACQSKKCTKQKVHTQGGALVSSAPTNQRIAPTVLLVQLRQLHPLKCTNQAERTPQQ